MSEEEPIQYDVIVIGGGPVGLAAAYECGKANQNVLVLEQDVFYNYSGSSGDLVRMFRTAYTEDFMATLAYQSMPIWDELERASGEQLRLMSGLLNFGDPDFRAGPEGTLLGPIPNLQRYGMRYTELNRDQIQENFPFQNLPDKWIGIDMPDNGCINVPLLLRTLHKLCEAWNVRLSEYSTVTQIVPSITGLGDWVVTGTQKNPSGVTESKFEYFTDKIIITPGAYVNHVLHPSFGFSLNINIWEMVFQYYSVDFAMQPQFSKMWFQFQEDSTVDGKHVSNLIYGFPVVPWGPPNVCRIAVDAATNVIRDPNERSYNVISPEDVETTRRWIIEHVRGLGPHPVPVFAGACLQTNVDDNMFVLDFIPDRYLYGRPSKSIVLFTAGWAMKFVPLLGRVLKELILDGNSPGYDLSHFSIERQGIIHHGPLPTQSVPRNFVGSSVHRHEYGNQPV